MRRSSCCASSGWMAGKTELRAAVEEFERHALTLTLLGNYLRRAHQGDIRKRKEIDLHRADEKQGGHAFRVIAAYARWLGEGPEVAILRLLGLFDRPADGASLKALRAAPPIPGLTEPLVDLSNEDWRLAVTTLRDHGLLAAADPREPETLDAHPLVRACFAEELESHRPRRLAGRQPAPLRAPVPGSAGPPRHLGSDAAALRRRRPRLPGGAAAGGDG